MPHDATIWLTAHNESAYYVKALQYVLPYNITLNNRRVSTKRKYRSMSSPSMNTSLATVTKALRYSHLQSEHAFIEDLPLELLENIVKHLSPESSSKIKSTSRYMQEMVPLTTEEEWEEHWKRSHWSLFPVKLSWEEEYRFQSKRDRSQQACWSTVNTMRLIPEHVFEEEYTSEIPCKRVNTITTTSDGKYIALTYVSFHILSIFEWDLNKMVKVRDLTALTSVIATVAVSPDCERIAASADCDVAVWNLSDGRLLYDIRHYLGLGPPLAPLIVTALAFDSHFLLLGSKCGRVRVCDVHDEYGDTEDIKINNTFDEVEFSSSDSIVSIRIVSKIINGVAGWHKDIYVSTFLGEVCCYSHDSYCSGGYYTHAHQDYMEEGIHDDVFEYELVSDKDEDDPKILDIAMRYNYLQGLPSANVMYLGDDIIIIMKGTNTVRVRNWEIEVAMENQIVYNCALSPDHRRFFVITSKPVMCDVWDVNERKKICSYTFGNKVPQDICWSPDGLSITVAIDDVLLRLVPSVIHI